MSLIIISFLIFSDLEAYFTELLVSAQSRPLLYAWISSLILIADILLPVPSSIVMYTNGFVLGTFTGTLVSWVALMIGAVIGYYLGRFSAMGLKASSDSRSGAVLTKYGALSILITRGIPVLSESLCFLYGYHRMPLKKYLLFNAIGYLPVSLLYALCGSIGFNQNTFLISFGISITLSAVLWFLGRKLLQVSFPESTVQGP